MPSPTKVARLVRLATLPETRRAVIAAARSDSLREIARRAANDRAALARDLMNPANARELLRSAVRHPASRELGSASLLFMPGRYVGLRWVATRATDRIVRKYVDPPVDVLEAPAPGRSLKNVTPTADDGPGDGPVEWSSTPRPRSRRR